MMDFPIPAPVNPYVDNKAAPNAASRDGAKQGAFGEALSNARDEKPAARDAVQDRDQTPNRNDATQAPQDESAGVDEGSDRAADARKLLDAVTNGSQFNVRTSIKTALSGQGSATGELSDEQIAAALKNGRPASGKKTDEKTIAEAGKGKDTSAVDAEETPAKTMPSDISAEQVAALLGLKQSASAVDEISKVVSRDGGERPLKINERDSGKTVSARDTMLPAVAADASDTDLPADGGGESTFRFASGKAGGGRAMDMSISRGEGKLEFEVRDASGKGADVTVVDSRRYLGLAPSSNASALTSLIGGDSEWVSAMQPGSALSNAAAQSSTGRVVHTLKLHMTPIDLGSVTMSLRLVGDELAVHMTVETTAAYRKLSDDSKGILDALKAQGLSVDQVTISISSANKSDQPGAQTGGQQQNENGQQTAEGRERDQSGGRNAQRAENEAKGGRDGIWDSTTGSASGDRTSGVYL
jgi:chemotaxis protein MotD